MFDTTHYKCYTTVIVMAFQNARYNIAFTALKDAKFIYN